MPCSSSIQRSPPISSPATGTWDQSRPGLCRSHPAWAADGQAYPGQIPFLTTPPVTDHNVIVGPVDRGKAGPEMEFPQGQLGGLWESCQHGGWGLASAHHRQHQLHVWSILQNADGRRQETHPAEGQKELCTLLGEMCEELLRAHSEARSDIERATVTTDLMTQLNTKRQERWTETVESIDFIHSSRRTGQMINKLTGQATKPTLCLITADAIVAQLISNGRFLNTDKSFTRKTTGKVNEPRALCADLNSGKTLRMMRWCRLSNTWS